MLSKFKSFRLGFYYEQKVTAIQSAVKLFKICRWNPVRILKKREHEMCLIPYIPETITYVFKDLDSTITSHPFVKEDQDRLYRAIKPSKKMSTYSGIASLIG